MPSKWNTGANLYSAISNRGQAKSLREIEDKLDQLADPEGYQRRQAWKQYVAENSDSGGCFLAWAGLLLSPCLVTGIVVPIFVPVWFVLSKVSGVLFSPGITYVSALGFFAIFGMTVTWMIRRIAHDRKTKYDPVEFSSGDSEVRVLAFRMTDTAPYSVIVEANCTFGGHRTLSRFCAHVWITDGVGGSGWDYLYEDTSGPFQESPDDPRGELIEIGTGKGRVPRYRRREFTCSCLSAANDPSHMPLLLKNAIKVANSNEMVVKWRADAESSETP